MRGHKAKRTLLWQKDNKCLFCGVSTINDLRRFKTLPSNAATLDHLYSNTNPLRETFENICVLSCNRCNIDRSKTVNHLRISKYVVGCPAVPIKFKDTDDLRTELENLYKYVRYYSQDYADRVRDLRHEIFKRVEREAQNFK